MSILLLKGGPLSEGILYNWPQTSNKSIKWSFRDKNEALN